MTDMLERAARAAWKARTAYVLSDGRTPPRLDDEIARAVIEALMEPDIHALLAGRDALSLNGLDDAEIEDAKVSWQAMLRSILREKV